MEKLDKLKIIKGLMPQVKQIVKGSQLQQFRAFRSLEGLWLYELKFFPGPRKGAYLGRSTEEGRMGLYLLENTEEKSGLRPEGLEATADPVQLYMRAHIVNRRLLYDPSESIQEEGSILEFVFEGDAKVIFEQEGSQAKWSCSIAIPGKKTFTRQVSMHQFSKQKAKLSESRQLKKAEMKLEKLQDRVRQDLAEAREGLEHLAQVTQWLERHPNGERSEMPKSLQDSLDWIGAEMKLQPGESLRQQKDRLFQLRRRFLRKEEGALKRLDEVMQRQAQERKPQLVAQARNKKENSRAGLMLQHKSGIMALLGRKQKENADLYRQAHSRDVWFHVRGQAGGHVWIPRGQKGLSYKEELSQELKEWGAKLALYNSKARSSGFAVVDFTEKRHLKSVKGQEGVLIIRRSETLAVEIDETFSP